MRDPIARYNTKRGWEGRGGRGGMRKGEKKHGT